MCRWAAWIGAPVFLEHLVSRPGHSLVHQSQRASECKTEVNADGFGLAWYAHRPEPGLFRDTLPAWSDPNLRALAEHVRSPLFMAHVRASTGTATSRNNCHPFAVGRWSFMHNGQLGGFNAYRKAVDMRIPDALYDQRRGATDSEALFLLMLAEGLADDPSGAMARALGTVLDLARTFGSAPHLRCSAALSDGVRLYLLRWSSDGKSPSLYHSWDPAARGRIVVSEPLETRGDWIAVPEGTLTVFHGADMEQRPFTPLSQMKKAG